VHSGSCEMPKPRGTSTTGLAPGQSSTAGCTAALALVNMPFLSSLDGRSPAGHFCLLNRGRHCSQYPRSSAGMRILASYHHPCSLARALIHSLIQSSSHVFPPALLPHFTPSSLTHSLIKSTHHQSCSLSLFLGPLSHGHVLACW
jgi:hypothetical protein